MQAAARLRAATPPRRRSGPSANRCLPSCSCPVKRASFTVSDIAGESALEPARVEAVLETFSIGFGDTRDAAAAVTSCLRGANPLARTCLARDAACNYLPPLEPGREPGRGELH